MEALHAVPHLIEFPYGSITICTASPLKHSCPRGMTTQFDPLSCRLTPKYVQQPLILFISCQYLGNLRPVKNGHIQLEHLLCT